MFQPSAHQQRIFDWIARERGSAVVIARAGSGKSTTIVQSLRFIPEQMSVTIYAFNTAIAKEMSEKIDRLRQEVGRAFTKVQARTFHSVGYGVVRRYLEGKAAKIDVSSSKLRTICDGWLSEEDGRLYGSFICKLVSLAKGQGIGPLTPDTEAAWWDLINHHDLVLESENAVEDRAVMLARELLQRSNERAKTGLIDYDDQLYLVLLWKLRLYQVDWVFIDEAQDTNPVRRALAKLALRPGGRLVAVGDDRQAIYGFCGATHDAIYLIERDFAAIRLPLTVSYRCARKIIIEAQRIVPDIEAADGAEDGQILHQTLNEALPRLTNRDAILCRNVAPLVSLLFKLIARNVPAKVLGRDFATNLISLVKNMRASDIDRLQFRLSVWAAREIARYTAKGEEQKADGIEDRVACINAVIDNLPEDEYTIQGLTVKIEGLFSDENGVLMLSTVHKAKGREWDTVAVLDPWRMPSRWARQDWQQRQEQNLIYVCQTRARKTLMYLTD